MSEVEKDAKVWRSGIPTAPSIRKIRETWPEETLQKGQLIKYEEVEEVIGVRKGTNRWKSVTGYWRDIVESQTGWTVGTRRSVGFLILDNQDAAEAGRSKNKQAVNAAKRSMFIHSSVDPSKLTEVEKRRFEHSQKKAAAFIAVDQVKDTSSLPSFDDLISKRKINERNK